MQIGKYSYAQFADLAASFHGSVAPGLLIGGIMVQEAVKRLPDGILYDAISETRHCLPDARCSCSPLAPRATAGSR